MTRVVPVASHPGPRPARRAAGSINAVARPYPSIASTWGGLGERALSAQIDRSCATVGQDQCNYHADERPYLIRAMPLTDPAVGYGRRQHGRSSLHRVLVPAHPCSVSGRWSS